jgi:hypothetical protein
MTFNLLSLIGVYRRPSAANITYSTAILTPAGLA